MSTSRGTGRGTSDNRRGSDVTHTVPENAGSSEESKKTAIQENSDTEEEPNQNLMNTHEETNSSDEETESQSLL